MSSPRKEKVVVGSVIRRPKEEVLAEMAALARQDRKKLGTPFPPAPRPQGRFSIVYRPPLPRPINPVTPKSPERPVNARAAAMSARARQDERKVAWEREEELRAWAREHAARRRPPTPPRDPEDVYDLAKFSVQRW